MQLTGIARGALAINKEYKLAPTRIYMPNGGVGNCGYCKFSGFHQEQREMERLRADQNQEEPRFERAYCQIRKVEIGLPLYTHCNNFFTRSDVPEGPIFSDRERSGVEPRIPWNGSHEPRGCVTGKCVICDRVIEKGIEVDTDEGTLEQFCCNGHYVRWWKTTYPGHELAWDSTRPEPE
jgi:hypothetical protein